MFTGLIEDVGRIAEIGRRGEQFRVTVAVGGLPTADIRIGDSIAVNGVCLTLVTVQPGSFAADVSPETVARTSLAFLKPGDAVNLESDILGRYIEKLMKTADDSKHSDLNMSFLAENGFL